jgi:hypothetical protein
VDDVCANCNVTAATFFEEEGLFFTTRNRLPQRSPESGVRLQGKAVSLWEELTCSRSTFVRKGLQGSPGQLLEPKGDT